MSVERFCKAMQILHGTWIPDTEEDFVRGGAFYFWAERLEKHEFRQASSRHPWQATPEELASSLVRGLGISTAHQAPLEKLIQSCYFCLPTVDNQPLPSLALSRFLEEDTPPEESELQFWEVDCLAVSALDRAQRITVRNRIIPVLNMLHFIALNRLSDLQLGSDLLFWVYFTQALKRLIYKDAYIPFLKYRELRSPTRKPAGRKKSMGSQDYFEIYPGWEFIGEEFEELVEDVVDYMPRLCAAGMAEPKKHTQFYNRNYLLLHFSECLLTDIVMQTPLTKGFQQTIADSLIEECWQSGNGKTYWTSTARLNQLEQWQVWRDRIIRAQSDRDYTLYFHLLDPAKAEDPWQIQFEVAPKQDPSLRLTLTDYWRMRPTQQQSLQKQFGETFTQNLLMDLGYAARIYPTLWQGLETDQPVGITLDLAAAFEFLKESAWILENAGYKTLVPAWWTPQGRQRAKVRLKAQGKSISGGPSQRKNYFSLDNLVKYDYELAIGSETVTEQEWEQLVQAKTPLVHFRGQWLELDQDKMQQMLEFWKTQQQENPELSLLDFMKVTGQTSDDELEVECDPKNALTDMLAKLDDKAQLKLAPNPKKFQGKLRDYQKRGLSWLQFLESLSLNGCLADDMGLGKTIQIIARLLQEREALTKREKLPPTLLVAPTSVLGNWFHEVQRFGPSLTATVHHGGNRVKDLKQFKNLCQEHDIVITSFALARLDSKFFKDISWHRIVLDEAQNIKNPKAAVTKAIAKFEATHRLALTGTPIENRLLDLWSIFNFLNPGYLDNQTQFRRRFETPIQRSGSMGQSIILKKLVEPFILRRVKTDRAVIADLPDKVEQKLFCNLTKEQASLYEAVVKDIDGQLNVAEGIQRKGLILAALTKLKQVCNHPRHFLQDDSEFSPARSHKLARLTEMVEEAMAEGESLLIFTQFRELGAVLEKHLRQVCRCNTYYIHGGTTRKKREAAISEFQDPETEPSAFVLSLKAGGVGITLTQANQVFHFDSWWNPSVEDQATD
ncbi:MAG: DEAD/DEAH box helicase, partial [Cyanobacteria bacterium P01_H01_bin.15]